MVHFNVPVSLTYILAQSWRGNAKGRHILAAVVDRYEDIFAEYARKNGQEHPDAWTLIYMQIRYVPAILETINKDNSGFVTIKELNEFTESRPQHWS